MKKIVLAAILCCFLGVANAQEMKFGKVTKEELSEKVYPKDSTAKAAYLYKSKNIYYEYDGTTGWRLVTEVHERIKLYSKSEQEAATKVIKLFKRGGHDEKISSLKAYTYNLVGNRIKREKLSRRDVFNEETSKNWKTQKFTMPNLQDGCIVEWSYKKKSPYHYYIDDIAFQHYIPIKKLDIRLRIPEYFVFKKHYKGYLFTYFKESAKNRTINFTYREKDSDFGATTSQYRQRVDMKEMVYTLNENYIPAINPSEPYSSNITNYIGGVKFELNFVKYPNSSPKYFTTTWEDVVKKIYKSSNFGDELRKSNYFKDELASVVKSATTATQKISAIFTFVKNKMKWNKKYGVYTQKGVKKAYREGTGNVADINLMLTSMFRAAGLDANPILVSTRDNDTGVLSVPTIDGFNYVVSAVKLGKGYVVFDASEVYSEPNVLPLRAITRQGRIVNPDGSSAWLDLTPNKYSLENSNLFVTFNDDFSVKGMLRTSYANSLALDYRNAKNHVKDEDLINKLEENYKIETEGFKVANKLMIGKPILRSFKFSGEDMVEEISGKIYVTPLLFLATTTNPFKLKERKFPVDFGVPLKYKISVSIQAPKGYKIESLPSSEVITISNEMCVYGYKVIAKGSKISVISQLQVNSPVVTPEFYNELKEFFNRMIKKQAEKIVFVKE
ncbi:MAG: hypothetical protein HWD85_05835 [Flavobacteriaceae bacterium]|nr:hypothetical protein [Flavobacteriaceae bacterium]